MYLLSVEEMSDMGVEAQVATEVTPSSEVEFAELKGKIRAAVMNLPPQQKQVVELFFHKGINQKTIAEKLKLSRPKVCRLINKAIKILKAKVK